MVTTTLALVALAGALSAGASPSPSWQTDYAQAMTVASAERKPMAVFIGPAARKPGQMISDGTISDDAVRLLHESYVCVYLDTDTGSGKDLAGRFELTEGLVISSPGGSVQALRHSGAVGGAELTRQLGQYATAGQPITTVTTGIASGSAIVGNAYAPVFVGGTCVGGNCSGTYYYYAPTNSAPVYGTTVYPATYSTNPFGSSCPNGRCAYQR